jgi:uncharacterized protein (TIGR00290 family)
VEKVLFTWSGGKDSGLALHALLEDGSLEVAALLTTVTEPYDRVSMHGVRRGLLEAQARAIGLPLEIIALSADSGNEEFEEKMAARLRRYRAEGISRVAFGDIFLEDLRKYREENLARVNMAGLFPLWNQGSGELAHRFIRLGFRSVIVCVDTQVLDRRFAGREFDESLLRELPESVDPCGENGEFHSFVYDGPIFREIVRFTRGEAVLRDGRFLFQDLLPA